MTILNVMLGSGRGGLEQASIDYAEALALAGYRTLTVTSPGAWANGSLKFLPHTTIKNFSGYDPLAVLRLRQLARHHNATTVICHGNRALRLASFALDGRVPIVAIAHNYSVKRFVKADRVLCISQDLMQEMARLGYPDSRVVYMPNMIRIPANPSQSHNRTRPVISAMGRFVDKKGFDLFIDAVRILKERRVEFHALLGGEGEAGVKLRERAAGLQDVLTFTGWVSDKSQFFRETDVFVLPSRHEPFGIVLLEAMAHGVPVVTTDAEGPREIVHADHDAVIVPRENAEALADAIEGLLRDRNRAQALATEARQTATTTYSVAAMAERLKQLLSKDLKLGALA